MINDKVYRELGDEWILLPKLKLCLTVGKEGIIAYFYNYSITYVYILNYMNIHYKRFLCER